MKRKQIKTTWSLTVINVGNDDDTCAAEHRNHRKTLTDSAWTTHAFFSLFCSFIQFQFV